MKRIDKLPAPQLDVRDLRVVVALARHGTTAAAAHQLHITQSAVSRALAVAEDRAGTELFTRTPRGLVPTEAGRLVVEAAPGLLTGLAALERRLRAPRAAPRRFRLASECFMAYPFLVRAYLRLQQSAPGLRLELPVEHSDQTATALAEGTIDGAMMTTRAPKGAVSRPLFEDELVFMLAADHPLADKKHLTPKDLTQYTLLVPAARAEDAWFMRTVFGSKWPRLDVRRLPITEAIVELTRAGLGVGILSEWVSAAYLAQGAGDLVTRRLRRGPLCRKWRLAVSEAQADVLDLLAEAITQARPMPPRV